MTAAEILRDLIANADAVEFFDYADGHSRRALVTYPDRRTLAALEAFDADSEDDEEGGDLEPSIGSYMDMEGEEAMI